MKLIEELLAGAKALGACRKAGGIETLDQLLDLFLSPQGIEFCMNHNYPNRKTWKKIKEHFGEKALTERNIFIDDPIPVLDVNPGTIILVGERTSAYITAEGAEQTQRIIVLHGASAKVGAKNYAVLNLIYDKTARIDYQIDKTSILL